MISIKVDLSSLKLGNIEQIADTVTRQVAFGALGLIGERVFEKGLASDGQKIGDYNKTDPMYVNPENAPRKFIPEGKYGDKTFKSGKRKGQAHKTKYFSSYDSYKTFVGRNQIGSVNLSLSGQLSNQFKVVPTSQKSYGLGWLNNEMVERAKWFEKKYNKPIWMPTKEEIEKLNIVAKDELKKYL